jgi:hypothetical protein
MNLTPQLREQRDDLLSLGEAPGGERRTTSRSDPRARNAAPFRSSSKAFNQEI